MKDNVSYGYRSITETILSSMIRVFGDNVSARKSPDMAKEEMMLKASLYNIFVLRKLSKMLSNVWDLQLWNYAHYSILFLSCRRLVVYLL
jgi:hypothetical protein